MKYAEITEGLGTRFELLLNTYKPFACGIVMHPTIDACLQLRAAERLSADRIERIDLAVHPLVLELTGKKTPQTGLEGKFSIYTAAALAIVAGAAGPKQFTDAWVRHPDASQPRSRGRDRRSGHRRSPGAGGDYAEGWPPAGEMHRAGVGSVERPMSDADLTPSSSTWPMASCRPRAHAVCSTCAGASTVSCAPETSRRRPPVRKDHASGQTMKFIAFAVAASSACIVALAAQQAPSPPPFRASVDLIALDVQVADKDGAPITSLRPAQFTVTLDGKPRRVVSADLIGAATTTTLPQPSGEAPPASSTGPAGPAPPDRICVPRSTR